VKQIRFFIGPSLKIEAIADHVDVVLAGILLHAADAIRDEVEDVVFHPQGFFFRLRRGPVQHVDVVAAL
jgi:hypothetical protein